MAKQETKKRKIYDRPDAEKYYIANNDKPISEIIEDLDKNAKLRKEGQFDD